MMRPLLLLGMTDNTILVRAPKRKSETLPFIAAALRMRNCNASFDNPIERPLSEFKYKFILTEYPASLENPLKPGPIKDNLIILFPLKICIRLAGLQAINLLNICDFRHSASNNKYFRGFYGDKLQNGNANVTPNVKLQCIHYSVLYVYIYIYVCVCVCVCSY
jgi:hypothetical protein